MLIKINPYELIYDITIGKCSGETKIFLDSLVFRNSTNIHYDRSKTNK